MFFRVAAARYTNLVYKLENEGFVAIFYVAIAVSAWFTFA